MKTEKTRKKKKKYVIAVRVYEALETCLLEYDDKLALDLAYADIKTKLAEKAEPVRTIKGNSK